MQSPNIVPGQAEFSRAALRNNAANSESTGAEKVIAAGWRSQKVYPQVKICGAVSCGEPQRQKGGLRRFARVAGETIELNSGLAEPGQADKRLFAALYKHIKSDNQESERHKNDRKNREDGEEFAKEINLRGGYDREEQPKPDAKTIGRRSWIPGDRKLGSGDGLGSVCRDRGANRRETFRAFYKNAW